MVFDYTQRNGSTVAAGEQFSTKILLKTAPKTVADWIIRADVSQDADLSLCTISVKEYGHDISYVNLSTKARKVASADPTKYSSGWLELYKLTNIGENYYLKIFLERFIYSNNLSYIPTHLI